jgi:hypothetical protein
MKSVNSWIGRENSGVETGGAMEGRAVVRITGLAGIGLCTRLAILASGGIHYLGRLTCDGRDLARVSRTHVPVVTTPHSLIGRKR